MYFTRGMIKKICYYAAILVFSVGCISCNRTVVHVTKPKKHWLPYKHSSHKNRKRTKTVRMKGHKTYKTLKS